MPDTKLKSARNQSIECCKLIAAIFVVFIHVKFPGNLGNAADCLARFAVPMFFAISGYFNYQASSRQIVRRMKHILSLNLAGIAAHLLWGCFLTVYSGGSAAEYLRTSMPNMEQLVHWIILHINPFAGHLWYLTAIGACYLIFWAYVRFWGEKEADYRPLYFAGLCLLTVYFVFDIVLPSLGSDMYWPYYRNGWFLGLPMFTMGIFLHEHQERILANYSLSAVKLGLLVLFGAALSVLQWQSTGSAETPFGTFIEVPALMLLLVTQPKITVRSGLAETLISKLGFLSTAVYILQLIVHEFYCIFCQSKLLALLGTKEKYLQPLAVAGLSLIAGILCACLRCMAKQIRGRLRRQA